MVIHHVKYVILKVNIYEKEGMKKIINSAIISATLTVLGMLVNIIGFKMFGNAPLAITYRGGEIISRMGFGIIVNTTYPLGNGDISLTTFVEFFPLNFLMYFTIIFVIVFAITFITTKLKKKTAGWRFFVMISLFIL